MKPIKNDPVQLMTKVPYGNRVPIRSLIYPPSQNRAIAPMKPPMPVKDVKHWNGNRVPHTFGKILVKRLFSFRCASARCCNGHAQDRIRTQTGFIGSAIESDQFVIQGCLVPCLKTKNFWPDHLEYIFDCLPDTLSEVPRLISVAEFNGLVLAGRRT